MRTSYINPGKIKEEKKLKIKKESIYPKDKSGKGNPNIISEEIWIERKNLILHCGIDLQKFGWVKKVIEKTGYTKRIIENTIKNFKKISTENILEENKSV